jgi:hypothetical protein
MTEPHAERPLIRIGNAERDAAVKALDEHLSAGRLDPEEYGERYARATVARTQDELSALFSDLPLPHATPQPPPAPPVPVRERLAPIGRRWAATVAALIPIIALALFFTTGFWIVFLLIPLTGALFGGGGGARYHGYRRCGGWYGGPRW